MITSYHRPASLDQALDLAAEPDAIILGGGTVVGAERYGRDTSVVDLQDVGLTGISQTGHRIHIGAMVRLTDLAEDTEVPPVLADLARRELPRSLRNSATVGGTIATGARESQFLAGLLAFDAIVSLASRGSSEERPLSNLLAEHLPAGSIITSVSIDAAVAAAADRTARTPGDVPIVAAVATRNQFGTITLALSGVAATPVVVDPANVSSVAPDGDFRGSAEYRSHLAQVLTRRVVERIGGAA